MIHGNVAGIRESVLADLEKLYDLEFERDLFLPDRLLSLLVRHTTALGRELMVYMTREGSVIESRSACAIASVGLPERHLRRNTWRLSGIRASIPTRAATRGSPTWTSRRFAFCALTPCAPWASPAASAAAFPPRFWARPSTASARSSPSGPVKPGRIPAKPVDARDRAGRPPRRRKAIREMDVVDEGQAL